MSALGRFAGPRPRGSLRPAFTLVELPAASRRGRKAFTLVELLVVVGIIGLLVTILMPSLSRAKELARRAVCATDLKALGTAWRLYFEDSNGRTPNTFNTLPMVPDIISQFNFLIWCGASGTTGTPDYVNAGVLFKRNLIPSEAAYVCPTLSKWATSWFGTDLKAHRDPGGWEVPRANPWPVASNPHTFMTYGTRRMKNYDDSTLSALGTRDEADDEIMIWSSGTNDIRCPSDFSFMADNFCKPETAMASHVPGVNVMYLDSHVTFYSDDAGDVLYDNGITGWGTEYNWLHDDIWMIIDGYHRPPVGQ